MDLRATLHQDILHLFMGDEEETRSHEALTYDHAGAVGKWAASQLPAGQVLREPVPLFRKLDEGVVEEEYARLEGSS